MEVGELHFQRAVAALTPSFLYVFILSPDWRTVSEETALAAKAFKAAAAHEKEADALRLGIRAEDGLNRPAFAGRLLEQLGDLLLKHKTAARRTSNSKGYRSAAASAYEEGLECYTEAVKRYKRAEAIDFAVDLLLRIAEKREKEMSVEAVNAAIECFEEALELRLAREELPHASDVYRLYVCMLVRVGELQRAITITLRRLQCLTKLKQYAGVHKAILTVSVLFLALNQQASAARILSGEEALASNFIGSPEFSAGAEAVDAYKANDGLALAAAFDAPVFRLLLPPVVCLVTRMAAIASKLAYEFESDDDEVGVSGEVIDEMFD